MHLYNVVIPLIGFCIVAPPVFARQPCAMPGVNNGGFASTPWNTTFLIQQFAVPAFTRVDRITCQALASVSATALVRNGSNFTIRPSISASTTVHYTGPAGFTIDRSVSASGTGVVLANGTSNISATTSIPAESNRTIPSAQHALYLGNGEVTFTVRADAGSVGVSEGEVLSQGLNCFASLQFFYFCTAIGLTQADPILPTSMTGGRFTFIGVPSGRWFDPDGADGFRFDMTSAGDAFIDILDFPTGFMAPLRVSVNGVRVGQFRPGQSYHFPTGTTSFVVYSLTPDGSPTDPRVLPIKLAFNRDGVTFTMTPILSPACLADVDDGSGTGRPDGGVTIDDLLYYLGLYEAGDIDADVDGGARNGMPDGGVTIDDWLYYAERFAAGC